MRHRKSHRSLSRTSSHRKAMFANMVTSFFRVERIRTTDAKAKELRSIAEKLITVAKQGAAFEAQSAQATLDGDVQQLKANALAKRRQVARTIRDREILRKLFSDIQARFADRSGGYTRIRKIGPRRGDAAPMSLIELVVRAEPTAEVAPE